MSDPQPVLRIVRGDATPEELAALVTVLAARTGAAPSSDPAPASRWRDHGRATQPALVPGPGAWRASGLPH